MSELTTRIGLDNPAFSGRLRTPDDMAFSTRRTVSTDRASAKVKTARKPRAGWSADYFDKKADERSTAKPGPSSPDPVWSRPLSVSMRGPAQPRETRQTRPFPGDGRGRLPDPVRMLADTAVTALSPAGPYTVTAGADFSGTDAGRYAYHIQDTLQGIPDMVFNKLRGVRLPKGYTRLQMVLTGMAAAVFLLGVGVSVQSILANRSNTAKVTALSNKSASSGGSGSNAAGGSGGSAPSTVKPTTEAVNNYTVAPDLPRYIRIPKIGVFARVMQVGVQEDGSLAAPGNVYDAAWYTGSARPGDKSDGATLIDGHISSWTTRGVFYGLGELTPGDIVQIERGDGQVIKYRVVKSVRYPDNKVDMNAAIQSVTKGKAGLNLISCAGSVKPGTSEFDQRIVVFTEQM